ncbi:DUF305 domain-containing protein [Kribbella shirazensis]|uniref:Uncharacterized protein (DUF305 family) n=1 Tax=Kribbella shirazensis TaxID=1105143 RepID=A0A7X6A254_9ACTN|nr:DUF305 domain-containing protein [Kribbella shirazensis]NIK58550.1 uncharacterized protein (DUF305 family) [Kribbella shirazensis]
MVLVASVLLVLSAAACGEDGGGASSASTPVADFNEADVRFASEMILHHQQAVQLASMAGYQARSAQVKRLAATVGAAQEPEIKTLSAWLAGWGKPTPQQAHGHDEELPGMMTQDELHDLGDVPGAAFDRAWAQWMIKHHQGAIAMAKAQQTAGKSPAAVALAKKIELTRTKEITTLRQHSSTR